MKVQMELRAGEGGMDAKLLVLEQAKMYIKYCEKSGAKVSVIDEAEG